MSVGFNGGIVMENEKIKGHCRDCGYFCYGFCSALGDTRFEDSDDSWAVDPDKDYCSLFATSAELEALDAAAKAEKLDGNKEEASKDGKSNG